MIKGKFSGFFKCGETYGRFSYDSLQEAIEATKDLCKTKTPVGSKGYWEVSKGNVLLKQGFIEG